MVLLKGDSGAGKTTVLQAIYWALYGSMRGVYNNSGQMKKCSVTLKINQLVIYRQKRPELLTVTIVKDGKDEVYNDTVAQQIIDQAFGSRELWKSCSYVSQKDRCSLLSGSSSERLALLNQLSFDSDDPKEYISRIGSELKGVNQKFTAIQASFTAELEIFTNKLNTRPVTVNLSSEDIEKLQQTISLNEKETERLHMEVLNHERNIGSYNTVSSQLEASKSRLVQLPISDYNESEYKEKVKTLSSAIDQTKEQIIRIQSYNNVIVRRQKLQSDLDQYNSRLTQLKADLERLDLDISAKAAEFSDVNSLPAVTNQQIWETKQHETMIINNTQLAKNVGIEYDQETINLTVKRLQDELSQVQTMEHYKTIYNQIKQLEQQVGQMGAVDPNQIPVLENNNQQILLQISELKKGLELLQCPECSKPLRYVGGGLVKGDREPTNPADIQTRENNYRTNLSLIDNIRKGVTVMGQLTNLQAQIGPNQEALLNYINNPPNITNHNYLITQLSGIRVIQPPTYSSEFLEKVFIYHNLLARREPLVLSIDSAAKNIAGLQSELSNIVIPDSNGDDITVLQTQIYNYQTELQQVHQNHQSKLGEIAARSQLIQSIEQLEQQKNTLEKSLNPTAKVLYDTTKEMVQTDKVKLSNALYAKEILTEQKNLETKRAEVLKINEDLVALGRLKQNAADIECKQLQDTVDTINQTLSDILPLFFNEPISLSLQLFKVLKTKKAVKPGLNISIKYKGVEYDNINQLSGGEGDRISLALVLALNQVSNSPVILLDECISSLDGSLKESCIMAMKTFQGKTVVCVDHEGVEGYYDKTIQVSL